MNILPNYWVKITWNWKVNLLLKSFFLLNNFLNFFDHVIWSTNRGSTVGGFRAQDWFMHHLFPISQKYISHHYEWKVAGTQRHQKFSEFLFPVDFDGAEPNSDGSLISAGKTPTRRLQETESRQTKVVSMSTSRHFPALDTR